MITARVKPRAREKPRWWSTLIYIPLLYLAGYAVSRPIGLIAPQWRPDQIDLAGVAITFSLLLLTLPKRLERTWGRPDCWYSLGLRRPWIIAAQSFGSGLIKAVGLLTIVSAALMASQQAEWRGTLSPGQLSNALLLFWGVGLAEELLFRGWLMGELSLFMHGSKAVKVQALIFALLHPWYRAPGLLSLLLLTGLTLLGISLAQARALGHGSLWGPVALHGGLVGGWFLLQHGLLRIGPQTTGWWAGPGSTDINPVGGLIGLISIGILIWLQRTGTTINAEAGTKIKPEETSTINLIEIGIRKVADTSAHGQEDSGADP